MRLSIFFILLGVASVQAQLSVPVSHIANPGTYADYIITHTVTGCGTGGVIENTGSPNLVNAGCADAATSDAYIHIATSSQCGTQSTVTIDFSPSGQTFVSVTATWETGCSDFPYNGYCNNSIAGNVLPEDSAGQVVDLAFSGNVLTLVCDSAAPSAVLRIACLSVADASGGGGSGGSGSCLSCCNDLKALLTAIEGDTASIDGAMAGIAATLAAIENNTANIDSGLQAIEDELAFATGDDSSMIQASSDFTNNVQNLPDFTGSLTIQRENVTLDQPVVGALGPVHSGIASGMSSGNVVIPLSNLNATFAGALPSGGSANFSDVEIDLTPTGLLRDFIGLAILLAGILAAGAIIWKAIH